MPYLVEASLALTLGALLFGGAWGGLVAGYWGWLRAHRRPLLPPSSPVEDAACGVDVLVAVLNEERDIGAKLEDLRALEYPAHALRFFIVDGGSSDGTAAIVAAAAARDPRIHLVRHDVANKIAQLNAALPRLTAPYVLVTDADARMKPETLSALVLALRADPGLGIVGTPVARPLAHELERCHTGLIDGMRAAEARVGSASIVMGPCYLCRRELIESLPRDAFCDDVFISFHVLARGFRVGYVEMEISELRAPISFRDLVRHKCRKASAYLHEVFRHLPAAGTMPSPGRGVFLWRAAQFLVAPLLALVAVGLLLAAAWATSPPLGLAATLLPAVLLAAAAARPANLPWLQPVLLVVLLHAILLGVLMAYPFYRQSASYRKVRTMVSLPDAEPT